MPNNKSITKKYIEKNREHLREVKLIDHEKYPFDSGIYLWGRDSIAFVIPNKNQILTLQDDSLHSTLFSVFHALWDSHDAA